MRLLLIPAIFAISLTGYGQKFKFDYHKDYAKILERTNDSTDLLYYDKLLTRFELSDSTITDYEVLALLIGFTDNEYFKPYSYFMTEKDIYALNGNGKYEEALAMCDSFLVFVPVSQVALIEKSYAFYKLGQKDSSEVYGQKFDRIMNAMRNSGDGLTPETAFFALGPADGQNFVRKRLSSGIGTMGSGRDKYDNFVDILEATWEDEKSNEKKTLTLYFQIEHAVKTMFGDLNFDDLDGTSKKKEKKKKNRED
jgi:hypothetical protein